MEYADVADLTQKIQDKYPDAGIKKVEFNDGDNKATFYLEPTERVLASLGSRGVTPHVARASTVRRTPLDRSFLDLAITRSPSEEDPAAIFSRSMKYYYEDDIYGASIDVLTNFASKGFENDIDDPNIKAFYDTWCFDVNFKQMLDWIFFDFFRVGMVRTYKIVGKYEPGITYMHPTTKTAPSAKTASFMKETSKRIENIRNKKLKYFDKLELAYKNKNMSLPEELAAKKKMWSKGYMPIAYTVLNPLLVEIDGSLLFDKTKTVLRPSDELKKLFKKSPKELTDDEKEIIKLLPSEFKSSLEGGGGITLDSLYVGSVDYRKQPYERYPKPRGIKAFDSLEYKRMLKQADISTLDGITNYILKVTIGNDDYPAKQTDLEAVASLFNTGSKSFDVVWNHTLVVEKIVSPEIEAILGQDKYKQVNMDITGALAMSRAFFDGGGDVSQAEVSLMVKTVIEEIEYARRQVSSWVYNEYRLIAEAAGLDRFPRIRWDQAILRDIILYMSTISQLVDRRMLSYETALEELGFDYENELSNMEEEFDLVMDGTLGIIGSPFQKSGTQDEQKAPTGTPSSGRPKGKTATPKKTNTDVKSKTKAPNQSPSNQPSPNKKAASLKDTVISMSDDEFAALVEKMYELRENVNE